VKRVLGPGDYAEASIDVLTFGAEIAQRAGGELTAIHVWECMPQAPPDLKVRGRDGKPRKLEDVIREIALPMGLVDVKVCAVDEGWSGLKLMIRKEHR
jgi:hypothetical protein